MQIFYQIFGVIINFLLIYLQKSKIFSNFAGYFCVANYA